MPVNTAEYDRAYWLKHGHLATKKERLRIALDRALACLENEFNAARESGTSGLRAQAIAQVKQARLILDEKRGRA